MRTWIAVGVALVVGSGCASQQALVQRREEIRSYNAQTPIDLARIRSNEGVRGATWGMTIDEVIALKGPPNERAENALMYVEQIDGQAVPSTYLFLNGHLAEVKSRFDGDLQPSARLVSALDLKWGQPVKDVDQATAREELFDAAERWDLISAAIGASLLTTAAIAGQGRAHGAGYYPWWVGQGNATRAMVEHELKILSMPARDVVWASKDSEVHLVTLDSGLSEVTWASKPLGRRLIAQQMSAAGLNALAASM